MSSNGSLEIHDLRREYAGKAVISVPALTLEPGRITAVIGPSGAGKSTLLRLLAGLDTPTAGQVLRNGMRLSRDKLRRSSSLVMQSPLALRGTVLYNAMLAPRFGRASRKEAQAIARSCLQQVGLVELEKQDARTLSGGELVRLALARALAKDPAFLLLDEATANLDPGNIRRVEHVLAQVAQRGTGVVIITHNLAQARRLGGAVAVIFEGQLLAQGSSEEIFGDHPNPLVRAFVKGEMIF